MRSPTRWLAILATCGVIGGGAVALTHTTPDQAAAADNAAPIHSLTNLTTTATGSLTAANLNVQLLLNEANQLQTAITSARSTLARSLSSTNPAVTTSTTTPVLPTAGSSGPSSASLQAQSQQLNAGEAAVAAQRQQLANEASQLGAESQQLSAEQTQLQQEAAALAAAASQQPAPTTTTTSGKGSKNGSKGD